MRALFAESFLDKKAALVGIGAGRHGNFRGLDHFTGIANHFHLQILPMKIYLPSVGRQLDARGNLINPGTISFVGTQIDKFIRF